MGFGIYLKMSVMYLLKEKRSWGRTIRFNAKCCHERTLIASPKPCPASSAHGQFSTKLSAASMLLGHFKKSHSSSRRKLPLNH